LHVSFRSAWPKTNFWKRYWNPIKPDGLCVCSTFSDKTEGLTIIGIRQKLIVRRLTASIVAQRSTACGVVAGPCAGGGAGGGPRSAAACALDGFLMGSVLASMVLLPAAIHLQFLPATLATHVDTDVFSDAAIADRVNCALAALALPACESTFRNRETP
jgi:hypothetical protein